MISLAIIPLMVRAAPRLGMMDEPDPRKVHVAPVPRVGGWGIIIGALLQISSPDKLIMWIAVFTVLITAINIAGGFAVTRRMLEMFRK